MLEAALSEKNRLDRREPSRRYTGAQAREDYVRAKLMQQAAQLKNQQRKRANKNNVLFCDPLVTNKYEYEQITVPDVCLSSSESSSMSTLSSESSDDDSREGEFCKRPLFQSRRRRFHQARSYLTSRINEQLLRTSLSDDKLDYGTYTTLSPDRNLRKRSHDMVEDSDEERETKTTQSSAEKAAKESEGSLFSSPKIAKIAPYQDDKSDSLGVELSSTANPFGAGGQSKPSALRTTYSQRVQAQMKSKLANNNNNNYNSNNNNPPKSSGVRKAQVGGLAEIESSNPVSELISYKPVRSSDFEDSCKDEVVADNGQAEVGYFGWLTSKISYLSQSVFNKIIY